VAITMTDAEVRGRRVTVPLADPVAAAVILSKAMPSNHLDELIALLIGVPTNPKDDDD
jgi:hypothetical protein